jgi:alkanesulfonate monooxygenase SsuD/methylene tetrahydromethanopterin reductase-like flavin-dependent oxidoreductase (luciferase family)
MRTAIFIPLFESLSEPSVAVELAVAAEQHGWDGVFVWDHLLYREPVTRLADPWIVMAAMATATERVKLGPMVTPPARRRPQVLAREVATLDRLSNGRVIFGAGLGGDPGGELTMFDEELDPKLRAKLLDDRLELLDTWWRGDEAMGVHLLPPPLQRPRVPIWLASRYPHKAPVRRAARWDGWFPIAIDHPHQLAEQLALAKAAGADVGGTFDVAVQGLPGVDPTPWAEAGATWWLVRFEPWAPDAGAVLRAIEARPNVP